MKTKPRHKRSWIWFGRPKSSTFTITDEQLLKRLPEALMLSTHRDEHLDMVKQGGVYLAHLQVSDVMRRAITRLFARAYGLTASIAIVNLSNNAQERTLTLEVIYGKNAVVTPGIDLEVAFAFEELKRQLAA